MNCFEMQPHLANESWYECYPWGYLIDQTSYTDSDKKSSNKWNNKEVDHGTQPFVVNINEAAKTNGTYRTALWTGEWLQVTLMEIVRGGDVGLEMHPNTDQFLRIEAGEGLVKMGKDKNTLDYVRKVADDDAIMVPAGAWHNLINTGKEALKLYSIYAPPEHPFGTVHKTKEAAEIAEENDY